MIHKIDNVTDFMYLRLGVFDWMLGATNDLSLYGAVPLWGLVVVGARKARVKQDRIEARKGG